MPGQRGGLVVEAAAFCHSVLLFVLEAKRAGHAVWAIFYPWVCPFPVFNKAQLFFLAGGSEDGEICFGV